MRKKLVKSIRTNVLVGLVLITPLAVTLWIVNFLFKYLTNYIVPREWLMTEFSFIYRFAALLLVFIGLYLVGLFVRNFIGRSLYRLGDNILTRIPVIKTVYLSIRQISESLFNSRDTMFQQVVAVQFPRKGLYSIGFVTANIGGDFIARIPSDTDQLVDAVCVLVPTAPNPTTGFFLIVPRAEIVSLDIRVPDAMKMIISAGTVMPGQKGDTGKTLLDRLDEWLKAGGE